MTATIQMNGNESAKIRAVIREYPRSIIFQIKQSIKRKVIKYSGI